MSNDEGAATGRIALERINALEKATGVSDLVTARAISALAQEFKEFAKEQKAFREEVRGDFKKLYLATIAVLFSAVLGLMAWVWEHR